jgi:hypothetical protein
MMMRWFEFDEVRNIHLNPPEPSWNHHGKYAWDLNNLHLKFMHGSHSDLLFEQTSPQPI